MKNNLIKVLIYWNNHLCSVINCLQWGWLKNVQKPCSILELAKTVVFGISLNGQLHVHCVIPESKAYNYRLRLSHDGFGLWWPRLIYGASFSDHSGKFVERQFEWIGQTTNVPSKDTEQSWRHGSKRSVHYHTFYYSDRRPYKLNSPILPLNKWYNHF